MSENREIARAAGLVGAFTFLSRIAGLVRDSVVGYYFGTGMAADAFFVAFRIPNLLRRFVAEGAMSTAFIPVFTDYLTNRTRAEAVRAASALATLLAVLLAILTAVGMIFAPFWTGLFAPGFIADAGKLELTVRLTRMVFPYIFLISLVALAAGILNSVRHFAAPAMSPVLLNLSVITAAVLLCPHLEVPVEGLAYGVVVGGMLQLALQIPPLLQRGIYIVPLWEPRHEAVGRALKLMAPMLFGGAVYQINIMVDTILASMLPTGSVSYLWYADRVFEFPLGIFAVALGTAALPSFSAQAARGAFDELKASLAFSVRLTNFIVMPAAVGIMTLAMPITSVLFQRGAFGHAQVVLTGQALLAFAVGLWSVSMVRLLVPAFYALSDTATPVKTAAAAFAANLIFSLMLMGPVTASGESTVGDVIAYLTQRMTVVDLRHSGLALSTALAGMVNGIILISVLNQRLGGVEWGLVGRSMLRSACACIPLTIVCTWIADFPIWTSPGEWTLKSGLLSVAIGSSVAGYVGMQALLKSDELSLLLGIVRKKLPRIV